MEFRNRRSAASGSARVAGAFVGAVVLVAGIMSSAEASAQQGARAAFDRVFAPAQAPAENGQGDVRAVGVAGRVVDRFVPPVAAPIDPAATQFPRLAERASILRPCDSPGSGCRNPQAVTPSVVVPPIGPGTLPPASAPNE